MKTYLLRSILLLSIIFSMNSCSSDTSEASVAEAKSQEVLNYTYSANELEMIKLINDYRVSVGLNSLKTVNHISFKSEEHDIYMIANNVVNHNDFVARSENIINVLGAKTVAENIAFNYNSPQSALNAWLDSPTHKVNIEGDFTDFGISIRENTTTGKKYYTNIFAKI
jgi:uncharacterized protein YkwD